MKIINTICLILLSISLTAQSQINIQSGTKVQHIGGSFTMIDTRIVNSGDLQSSDGTFKMGGIGATNQSEIGGVGNTNIHHFVVDKFINDVRLLGDISVGQQLVMNLGNVDLNGHNITLVAGALIVGERESARIYGAIGGEIITTAYLNAPNNAEPANIGASITSASNLGTTTIRRGHLAQNVDSGLSIERYYIITPTAANSNLDATLRLEYFDAELNGHSETKLALWESEDTGISWSVQGKTTEDMTADYIELTGVESFARWTFSPSVPLSAKAFLQGAYNNSTGLMNDDLRSQNLIPSTEPYTALAYSVENANISLKGSPLTATGNDAIVDWILIELRSTPTTIITARAALIQRDGDIVDVDGVSPVFFESVTSGSYYIAIRHRNHLGAMSAAAISLD